MRKRTWFIDWTWLPTYAAFELGISFFRINVDDPQNPDPPTRAEYRYAVTFYLGIRHLTLILVHNYPLQDSPHAIP